MAIQFDRMKVIDGHHHLWQLSRFPYNWLAPDGPPARFGSKSMIACDYDLATHRQAFNGFRLIGSVHVQANCGAADPVQETMWLQQVSDQSGWPMAIIGQIDLMDRDWQRTVDRHLEFPALQGLRTPVAWDQSGRWRIAQQAEVLSDPSFLQGASYLAQKGLLLEMVVVPAQLPEVLTLAKTLPDLVIVLNHFCTLEPSQNGQSTQWMKGIESLATIHNVNVKLSGLWTVDKSWNAEILRPYVDHLIDQFGASRVVYGSNAPVECVNCQITNQFERLSKILSNRSREEHEHIFHAAACRIYNFNFA